MFHSAQKVQYWQFFEVARIAIFAATCYLLGMKLHSRHICPSPQFAPRSIIGRRTCFFCLQQQIISSCAQKVQYWPFFEVARFAIYATFLSIFRDKRVLQTYYRTATMRP
jgi:hypothetical protein